MAEIICPFCGFHGSDEYTVQLHIEEHHTEDSPFVAADAGGDAGLNTNGQAEVREDRSEPALLENTWTKCTRPGCGEYVLLEDVDEHLEVHDAIAAADRNDEASQDKTLQPRKTLTKGSSAQPPDIPRSPQKLHKSKAPPSNGSRSSNTILQYFSGSSHKGAPPPSLRRPRNPREALPPGRLGRRELGPHAYEKAMPADVRRRLINDALPRYSNRIGPDGRLQRVATVENETGGLINVLSDLCALDPETEITYLCDPSVRHVLKLRCDGNFCGYWNIQMLLSYLQSQTRKSLPDSRGGGDASGEDFEPLPNVLQIQDTIEQAWANDICPFGRIETGGVRGTRKWIGSHEALAFFTQCGTPVEALSFKDPEGPGEGGFTAATALLDHIEAYFISGLDRKRTKRYGTSHITTLPPMYFQRFGHSMTIVGLERRADGGRNLLVFDPSFATSDGVERLLAGRRMRVQPETLLRGYRRSEAGLARWDEFEIVVPKLPDEKGEEA